LVSTLGSLSINQFAILGGDFKELVTDLGSKCNGTSNFEIKKRARPLLGMGPNGFRQT
jgi:hypothetical protein